MVGSDHSAGCVVLRNSPGMVFHDPSAENDDLFVERTRQPLVDDLSVHSIAQFPDDSMAD